MKRLRVLVFTIAAIMGVSMWAHAQRGYFQSYRDQGGFQQPRNPAREAFQEGMKQGEWDARHNTRPRPRTGNLRDERSMRAFEIGYDRGYDQVMAEHGQWADRNLYQKGLSAGRFDGERGRGFNPRPDQWSRDEGDRRAFLAGYNRGYHDFESRKIGGLEIFLGGIFGGGSGRRDQDNGRYEQSYNQQNGQNGRFEGGNRQQGGNNQASLTVQGNTVIWQSQAPNARIFTSEDNKPEALFASGPSGTQGAPWISQGHFYVFVLRDQNGNELARTQVDLRR